MCKQKLPVTSGTLDESCVLLTQRPHIFEKYSLDLLKLNFHFLNYFLWTLADVVHFCLHLLRSIFIIQLCFLANQGKTLKKISNQIKNHCDFKLRLSVKLSK